jgi:acetate kinase
LARSNILVVNSGSSSIRLAAFDSQARRRVWSSRFEGVGAPSGRLVVDDEMGNASSYDAAASDHAAAIEIAFAAAARRGEGGGWRAVGHRLVHGGADFDAPRLIDEDTEARLSELVRLAPLHMPQGLAGVRAARARWPEAAQVACFDTAFHATLPGRARVIALPRELLGHEVRRYGFHGLSYQSIVCALKEDGADLARERVVVAHLGAGASICALKDGKSVETTMGFSTLSGLPMGTRCGDVDPGTLLYLLANGTLSPVDLERVLYEQSGLKALSGLSGNMKELLDRRGEAGADFAIDVFCYQARRAIGSLAGVLGGLDRLVFTGGIGANAPQIRSEICAGLEFLGVHVDARRNDEGRKRISPRRSPVLIEARATDEESVIAADVQAVLASAGG